jgi:hypothetical protein
VTTGTAYEQNIGGAGLFYNLAGTVRWDWRLMMELLRSLGAKADSSSLTSAMRLEHFRGEWNYFISDSSYWRERITIAHEMEKVIPKKNSKRKREISLGTIPEFLGMLRDLNDRAKQFQTQAIQL